MVVVVSQRDKHDVMCVENVANEKLGQNNTPVKDAKVLLTRAGNAPSFITRQGKRSVSGSCALRIGAGVAAVDGRTRVCALAARNVDNVHCSGSPR